MNQYIDNGQTKNIAATILNILAGLFCFITAFIGVIVGMVGLYFSSNVTSKLAAGDEVGAQQAASTANLLGNISFVILVVSIIAGIVFLLLFGGAVILDTIFQDLLGNESRILD